MMDTTTWCTNETLDKLLPLFNTISSAKEAILCLTLLSLRRQKSGVLSSRQSRDAVTLRSLFYMVSHLSCVFKAQSDVMSVVKRVAHKTQCRREDLGLTAGRKHSVLTSTTTTWSDWSSSFNFQSGDSRPGPTATTSAIQMRSPTTPPRKDLVVVGWPPRCIVIVEKVCCYAPLLL
jgi:hypothetical protein